MTKPNRVYFMKPAGLDGPIKVGCSSFPDKRLAELAAWSPWPLEVIGSVPGNMTDEQFLHRCFFDCHSHREWFHSTAQMRETIAEILKAGSIDAVRGRLVPKGSIRKTAWRMSPERRVQRSYASKISWAEKRVRKVDEHGAWHAPADVEAIMNRWRPCGRLPRPEPVQPTAAEIARLDEYLADPARHSVIPSWRKKPAPQPEQAGAGV